MKATTLKEKYFNFWRTIEESVYQDINILYGEYPEEMKRTIAHNAAFTATCEYYRTLEKDK